MLCFSIINEQKTEKPHRQPPIPAPPDRHLRHPVQSISAAQISTFKKQIQ